MNAQGGPLLAPAPQDPFTVFSLYSGVHHLFLLLFLTFRPRSVFSVAKVEPRRFRRFEVHFRENSSFLRKCNFPRKKRRKGLVRQPLEAP